VAEEGESTVPELAPSPDQVRAALDELLGWPGISRSPQLTELLRYVVEKTLGGEEGSIKAYSIAVDVFGRPQSFDPQADPIVRVQARRLRTLLEQFYDTGNSDSAVQIRLPLGRYVPEFGFATPKGGEAPDAPQVDVAAHRRPMVGVPVWPSGRFFFNALLGLCFTLVGVGLAVGLVRWSLPARPSAAATVPDFPSVTVGSFDNLTGEPGLDATIAQFGPQLSAALAKFDTVKVTPDAATMVVHGSIEEKDGKFTVKALLSGGGTTGIVWSTEIAPPSLDAGPALSGAVVTLAARLGNASGPLHAPGRAWLAEQTSTTVLPTLYLCDLRYMTWRDNRRMSDATTAIGCYDRLIATDPDNATALAAVSGIKAWRDHYTADPKTDLTKVMAEETTAAARAVSLQPADAFVYEQQGLVLARQGSLDAALGALGKAVELNPASMDALAANGLVLWLTQHYDDGNALAERTLSTISSPPPWYYMTRAFEALRERRYYDAIVAAQALAAGDEEYGPTVALAAAPVIGRSDIVDRYKPEVLQNPVFQSHGILPRLGLMMKPQVLLDRMHDGLVLAGIPPADLTGPFSADGTPRP
jgi:hypothetical protein